MSPYRRHTPAEAVAALDQLGVALAEYRHRSNEIARDLAEAVHVALHAGATWGEVGAQLSMTKQAARAHWGGYIQGMMAEREQQTRGTAEVVASSQQPRPEQQPGPGKPPPGQPPGRGQPPAPGDKPAELPGP